MELAQKFTDMADREQRLAEHEEAKGGIMALDRRDKHIARAGAFIEAAKLALEARV